MKNLLATSKRFGHMKKDCPCYATWHVKKGKSIALFCFEVNLVVTDHSHLFAYLVIF